MPPRNRRLTLITIETLEWSYSVVVLGVNPFVLGGLHITDNFFLLKNRKKTTSKIKKRLL